VTIRYSVNRVFFMAPRCTDGAILSFNRSDERPAEYWQITAWIKAMAYDETGFLGREHKAYLRLRASRPGPSGIAEIAAT
jgi:hypothetical protein